VSAQKCTWIKGGYGRRREPRKELEEDLPDEWSQPR
jgi:hypothetical protein